MLTEQRSLHAGGEALLMRLTFCTRYLVQGTCGSVYGVVPFVSRRSTGIVCGLVSAGGAVGGVINQAIFFLNTPTHGAYGAAFGLCVHC